MIAHVDVIEANREDWTRDPVKLIEEEGYFYGRGTIDMKAQAAVLVDNMMRFREHGYHPKRSIKLALTCGEESDTTAVDGAEWLTKHDMPAISAELALTEGIDGSLDAAGHRVALNILAAEKTYEDYTFEVTSPGGHSSRPVPDNAIYPLVRAVDRVSLYAFPVQRGDANWGYFARMAHLVAAEDSAAMLAVVRNPQNAAAVAVLDKNPKWHAMLRTTCVATMLSAGHAQNVLPQRAGANINCRIFPGVALEEVLEQLRKVANDPVLTVKMSEHSGPVAPPAPLTPRVLGPIEKVAATMWPGIPVVPTLEPGASDGQYLNTAGIPTYGVSGFFTDPDNGHVHGLNERVRVKSVYEGRSFLYQLVKLYAEQ